MWKFTITCIDIGLNALFIRLGVHTNQLLEETDQFILDNVKRFTAREPPTLIWLITNVLPPFYADGSEAISVNYYLIFAHLTEYSL